MKKVIVITGGNSGLGKATAKLLASKNHVVILGRNKKEIEKVSKQIKCAGFVCDVTDHIQIKNTFKEIVKKYKKIDCLINCAGLWMTGPIEDNDPEKIEELIKVNTLGPLLTVNAIVPQMKKQKHGRIINVVSLAGVDAKANRTVYYTSKWAMTGFTKSLKLELSPFNIGVMGFYPGFFETKIFEKAGNKKTDFTKAMPVAKCAKALKVLVDIDDDLVIRALEVESIKS